MFDIGWTEILVIAVVAIVVVGPKDLPRMLRSLGRYAGQLRRTASEFRSQFEDAICDSELDELRNTLSEASDLNPINQIRDSIADGLSPLKETAEEIKSGIEAPSKDSKPSSEKSSSDKSSGEGAKEDTAPTKKPRAKSKSKPKPKAETSSAKSGGEG
jgi:sec-independent protein translocase protein TatB